MVNGHWVTVNVNQNPYKNINEILKRLGIDASPVQDHQNHFHIYLNPPTPQKIGPNLLMADVSSASSTASMLVTGDLQTAPQGLIDYAQNIIDTGEEIMFIVDVPYVPVQTTPIVLAQAAVSSGTTSAGTLIKPNFLLKVCTEFSSGGGAG